MGERQCTNEIFVLYKKEPYMERIRDFIRAAGYEERDKDACETRIHTLVSAYRSCKDECEKTGNWTTKRKPAFFDEVDEFLSQKPCTKPKVVINSSQIIIGDSEADDEEDRGNIENDVPNEELPSFRGGTSSGSNNKTAGKFPQLNMDECVIGELSKLSLIRGSDNGPRKCFNIGACAVCNL